jgi:hypothetical protein
MDGANGEQRFAKVWVSKWPYEILGFVTTMVSYGV